MWIDWYIRFSAHTQHLQNTSPLIYSHCLSTQTSSSDTGDDGLASSSATGTSGASAAAGSLTLRDFRCFSTTSCPSTRVAHDLGSHVYPRAQNTCSASFSELQKGYPSERVEARLRRADALTLSAGGSSSGTLIYRKIDTTS